MAGSRNFVTLDGVADYFSLAAPVVFAGDFEIEVDFVTTAATGVILSGVNGIVDSIVIDVSTGDMRAYAYNGPTIVAIITLAGSFDDGVKHTAKLRYVGSTAFFSVDGGAESSATWTLDHNQDVSLFGVRGTVSYFNGVIANVKFTDLDTPSTQTFRINQATANTEYPLENVIGADVIVNGGFDTDTAWSKSGGVTIAGGVLDFNNPTDTYAFQDVMTIGKAYSVSVDYDIDSPQAGLYIGSNSGSGDSVLLMSSLTGTDTLTGSIGATAERFILRSTAGAVGVFDNISALLITNALTYNSLPTASREYYLFSCATGIWDSTTTAKQITGGPVGCMTKALVKGLVTSLIKSFGVLK